MTTAQYGLQTIFHNLQPFLNNPSVFVPDWVPRPLETFADQIEKVPILVVGAGGLGCELVKNLALSGVRLIHLVDMDTIDLTNLNRQFLFRKGDVGRHKADVVAQFVMRRCPGVTIVAHKCRLQEFDFQWFRQFVVIVGGLDNIEARRYLNFMAFQLNLSAEDEGSCVYIDGATEGFQGQALLVQPFHSSCYECSVANQKQGKAKANYCTIASTPRTAEHCIQYVLQIQWNEERKDEVRDNDNREHMQWVYEKSLLRAQHHKIEGVTEMLTLGVAKNIIPAIASTNALVAALCTNEVLKVLTNCHQKLDNYFLFLGGSRISSCIFQMPKYSQCRACSLRDNQVTALSLQLPVTATLADLLLKIKQKHECIQKPFIETQGKLLLNPGDSERWNQRIYMSFANLLRQNVLGVHQGTPVFQLRVTDRSLKDDLMVNLHIKEYLP